MPTKDPAAEPTVDSLRPDYNAATGPLADAVRQHDSVVGARPAVDPGDFRRPYRASGHQQMNASPSDANPWPAAHGSLDVGRFSRGADEQLVEGHAVN